MNVLSVVLWLTINQCSLAGAVGIAANLQIESRLISTAESRSGLGLPQWAGIRRTRMLRYLGTSWKDGYQQLRYLKIEAVELNVWDKVCSSITSPERSAEVFLNGFEKPRNRNPEQRKTLARYIYNYAKPFIKED